MEGISKCNFVSTYIKKKKKHIILLDKSRYVTPPLGDTSSIPLWLFYNIVVCALQRILYYSGHNNNNCTRGKKKNLANKA